MFRLYQYLQCKKSTVYEILQCHRGQINLMRAFHSPDLSFFSIVSWKPFNAISLSLCCIWFLFSNLWCFQEFVVWVHSTLPGCNSPLIDKKKANGGLFPPPSPLPNFPKQLNDLIQNIHLSEWIVVWKEDIFSERLPVLHKGFFFHKMEPNPQSTKRY